MREPDPGLVELARSGDLRAFESLVRAYQADAWRFAYHLTHDRSAADDITQEAFIRVFRSIASYRGPASFTAWFLRIVRNCAIDVWRRTARERPTDAPMEPEAGLAGEPVEDRLRIHDAIRRLPIELREPFVVIEILGFSYKEAAHVLSTNIGTLKSRMYRARAQLVSMLTNAEVTNEA